jgi:hypothetical protein
MIANVMDKKTTMTKKNFLKYMETRIKYVKSNPRFKFNHKTK